MSILKIKDSNNQWINIPAIKGDKGDKGDTYTLTATDKQDIADLSAPIIENITGATPVITA